MARRSSTRRFVGARLFGTTVLFAVLGGGLAELRAAKDMPGCSYVIHNFGDRVHFAPHKGYLKLHEHYLLPLNQGWMSVAEGVRITTNALLCEDLEHLPAGSVPSGSYAGGSAEEQEQSAVQDTELSEALAATCHVASATVITSCG